MYMYVAVPLFTGMFLFKYLHNEKSTGTVHSLPYTRSELLNNHCISGLFIINIPLLINSLIIFGISFLFDLGPEFTLLLFGKWILFTFLLQTSLFIFSIIAAIVTGTSSAQMVLGFIVLWLPLGLYFLWDEFCRSLLYGYAGLIRESNLFRLSPLTYTYDRGYLGYAFFNDTYFPLVFISQIIVFYILAHQLYKHVNIEKSGDVITFNFIKTVFRYGLTTCTALWIGLLILGLSKAHEYDALYYLGFFIGGFVGYLIAELVLNKTLLGLRRYKGFATFTLVFSFIFVAIGYDVIGYESKIPDISKIESVAFNNNSGFRRTHSNSEAIFENMMKFKQLGASSLSHRIQYITHRIGLIVLSISFII